MAQKIDYLIPQDIVDFITVPITGLKELGGTICMHDIAIQPVHILKGNIKKIKFCIDLICLDQTNRDILSTSHHINVHPFQLAFKITLDAFKIDTPKVMEFESELREHIIFSIILANKGIKVYYNDGGKLIITNCDGLDFLPYSFIKLTSAGAINTYYQSDYTRCILRSAQCLSRFEDAEIQLVKKLLNRFILSKKRPFKEPTIEMFIHCHTFSWIPKGLFYPAIVILFSCFESLLGKTGRKAVFNSDPLLSKFQAIRNAIPHLDGHDINYKSREYTVTQYKTFTGQILNPPKITILNIDEIEEIRKKLIELLLMRI